MTGVTMFLRNHEFHDTKMIFQGDLALLIAILIFFHISRIISKFGSK
jgi:hypothetical protein